MSDFMILDGTGKGFGAQVDSQNHLLTSTVTETIEEFHSRRGHSYNMNTGNITFTGTSKSAVLYLKNNEEEDLIVFGLFYLLGNSTGGTVNAQVDILRNPTTGTIIDTTPQNSPPVNRNFGSSNTLSVDALKGSEGDTFTNGEVVISSLFSSSGRAAIRAGAITLQKGSSLGLDFTPFATNTSMICQFAVGMYLDKFSI